MNKVYFKPSEKFKKAADEIYLMQKKRILKLLPNSDLKHIGSTAISDALTKGDLDIQVRVTEANFYNAINVLKSIYKVNQVDNWSKTYASFKDDTNFKIPVGFQLTVIDSEDDNLFKTQQLLLKNPKVLKEYNQLKLRFQGKSINNYRKEREKFFDKLKSNFKY
jgi:GrpB-like predicted nucleotidyltransferase (UPF0157 family)